MPPRLEHRKSRKGCFKCKARKVKCDEKKPVCGGCIRHKVPCEYPTTVRVSRLQPSIQHSISDDSASPSSTQTSTRKSESDVEALGGLAESEERRLLELRLMHNFAVAVAPTFSSTDHKEIKDIWCLQVPVLAMKFPFLLNSILALSALHLAWEASRDRRDHSNGSSRDDQAPFSDVQNPSPAKSTSLNPSDPDFASVHRKYFDLAISQQRQAVTNVGLENADAICLTASVITAQGLKLMGEKAEVAAPYPPLQWFRLAASIKHVVRTSRPSLPEDAAINAIINVRPEMHDIELLLHSNFHRQRFEYLLDWDRCPEPDFDDDTKRVYEEVVCYIGSIWQGFQDGEAGLCISRRFMSMAPVAPDRFIVLLSEGRPRALAILGHFFAMMKRVDNIWWYEGIADREVLRIKNTLTDEWQWAMDGH